MIPLKLVLLGITVVGAIGYAVYQHFSTEEQPRQHNYSYNDTPNSYYSGRSTPPSSESHTRKRKKRLSEKCSICLVEIDWRRKDRNTTLQCGHGFHLLCIESWLNHQKESTCPNCRARVL